MKSSKSITCWRNLMVTCKRKWYWVTYLECTEMQWPHTNSNGKIEARALARKFSVLYPTQEYVPAPLFWGVMQRDWMSFEVCPVSWVPLDPDGRWWHVATWCYVCFQVCTTTWFFLHTFDTSTPSWSGRSTWFQKSLHDTAWHHQGVALKDTVYFWEKI